MLVLRNNATVVVISSLDQKRLKSPDRVTDYDGTWNASIFHTQAGVICPNTHIQQWNCTLPASMSLSPACARTHILSLKLHVQVPKIRHPILEPSESIETEHSKHIAKCWAFCFLSGQRVLALYFDSLPGPRDRHYNLNPSVWTYTNVMSNLSTLKPYKVSISAPYGALVGPILFIDTWILN